MTRPIDLKAEPDVEKFLYGNRRFILRPKIEAIIRDSDKDHRICAPRADEHFDDKRTSDRDRRCGFDRRSEVEQFLQGERRSGTHRRSGMKHQYRSFKKARAYARSLGLKSASEWRAYSKSAMRPTDIPMAPHYPYADDWLGWSDWLGPTCR
jgi:hypothetical protein